jgi:transposase
MGRRPSEELDRLFPEAQKLVGQGMNVNQACKQVGINEGSYRKRIRREARKANRKAARKKSPPALIQVSELPVVPTDQGRAFMIFGSPAALAEFARNYQ